MAADPSSKPKEARIAGHFRLVRSLVREPGRIVPLARGWLVRLWLTKGGGFYGLGYVVAFVALEARTLGSDIGGSDSLATFVTSQAIQYVIRISFESILNAFLALVWPIYLIQWLEGWGIVALLGGYLAFVFWARPLVTAWFPELREAKRSGKRSKRANGREID